MAAAKNPRAVLPLPPYTTYILLSLLKGERHGYRILLDLRKSLEGKTVIGTTTLYRTIDRMLQEQLIVESDKRPDPALDDERRVYYRITAFGEDVLGAEIERMEEVLGMWRQGGCSGGNELNQGAGVNNAAPNGGSDWPGGWLILPNKRHSNQKTETDMREHVHREVH